MGKYGVLLKGIATIALTWFCWLLGAIILGNIDTAMYSIALAQGPQYMGWYSIITTVWNYLPILITGGVVYWMYVQGNGDEYEEYRPRGW
jgi:hypothetical protein